MEKKEILPLQIFPESKIKTLLKREDIGKIYGTAVNLVGNASAIFIQNIIQATGKTSITDEDVMDVLRGNQYADVININDDLLVNIPSYKKKRSPPDMKPSENDKKKKNVIEGHTKKKINALETCLGDEMNLKDGRLMEDDGQGRVIGLGEIVYDEEDYDD